MNFTLSCFPQNASIKDSSGLPWSIVLEPFSDSSELKQAPIRLKELGRCENCGAYINPYVSFARTKYKCSLCNHNNTISNESRYATLSTRGNLDELKCHYLEYEISTTTEFNEYPVYIAIIDNTGVSDYIETIKTAISALLESLNPNSYFGLIYFNDKVGLFNLKSEICQISNIPIHSKSGKVSIELNDIINKDFPIAVKIKEYKNCIINAIENIPFIIENEDDNTNGKPRAFGSCINYILNYFSNHTNNKHTRLINFIHGIPNYGKGSLSSTEQNNNNNNNDNDNNTENSNIIQFYKEQGINACDNNISIDLIILNDNNKINNSNSNNKNNNNNFGLKSIKYLSSKTMGNITYYDSNNYNNIAMDIYKYYHREIPYDCLLKIRTSNGFTIKEQNNYGNKEVEGIQEIKKDNNILNLYHLPSCLSFNSLSFDFQFTSHSGFSRYEDNEGIIQTAFSYSSLSFEDDKVVKKIRIYTKQSSITDDVLELYQSANAETIMVVLTRKIIQSIVIEGLQEAKLLLFDWIVLLSTNLHLHVNNNNNNNNNNKNKNNGILVNNVIDINFSKFTNMKQITRYVFGLYKNDILKIDRESDYWNYLQTLMTTVGPKQIHRIIYPVMNSYGSINNLASKHIPLSRSTLTTCGNNLFLIDNFFTIVVYFYRPDTQENIVFPPPKESLIRTTINQLKIERQITPRTMFIKEGSSDDQIVDCFLIEDNNVQGMSFSTFCDNIVTEVLKSINNL